MAKFEQLVVRKHPFFLARCCSVTEVKHLIVLCSLRWHVWRQCRGAGARSVFGVVVYSLCRILSKSFMIKNGLGLRYGVAKFGCVEIRAKFVQNWFDCMYDQCGVSKPGWFSNWLGGNVDLRLTAGPVRVLYLASAYYHGIRFVLVPGLFNIGSGACTCVDCFFQGLS